MLLAALPVFECLHVCLSVAFWFIRPSGCVRASWLAKPIQNKHALTEAERKQIRAETARILDA
jgi:hypothetical protein